MEGHPRKWQRQDSSCRLDLKDRSRGQARRVWRWKRATPLSPLFSQTLETAGQLAALRGAGSSAPCRTRRVAASQAMLSSSGLKSKVTLPSLRQK